MSNNNISAKTLTFDAANGLLKRDDQLIKLDPIIVKLLDYFIQNQEQVLSRGELVEHVWQSSHVSDDAVNRGISVLRKALGGSRQSFIKTVPKVGYQFTLELPIMVGSLLQQPQDEEHQAKLSSIGIQTSDLEQQGGNKRFFTPLVGSVIFIIIMLSSIWYWQLQQAPQQVPNTKVSAPSTINIAVLPFQKLSEQANQDFFVDGLTEEILNGLTQIKGLLVVERQSSFSYRDKNVDVEKIAQQLSVDYLLKGSVRRINEQLRITVQLVDTKTYGYLFSTVFERQVNDIFSVQQDISEQVAAALKLSLHHGESQSQYTQALEVLDHVSVEKLMIARAQIRRYKPKPVKAALATLIELNQKFADTPQIMGLLSYAHAVYASVASLGPEYKRQTEIDLAKSTLLLDERNIDALETLFYYYDDFSELREQAIEVSEKILQFHPGRKKAYKLRLNLMISDLSDCASLSQFIKAMPDGVYPPAQMQAINMVINSCKDSSELTTEDLQQRKVNAITISRFGLYHDEHYLATEQWVENNPNQRFISQIYQQQLSMGAKEMAINSGKKIDHEVEGYWSWLATLYGYLYDQDTVKKPSDFIGFMQRVYHNNSEPYFIAALLHEYRQSQQPQLFKQQLENYLAGVPEFQMSLANRQEIMGLMMLQYQLGLVEQSQQTATHLLNSIHLYRDQAPDAYKFWTLAGIHFVSAAYAQDWTTAEQILEQGFAQNTHYWQLDWGFMRSVLAPWQGQPSVVALLERIKQDRARARRVFSTY